MRITPSMLGAFVMCPREAWFMSRAISPEEDNYFLTVGRLIHEESYLYMNLKEIEIEGAKIDFVTEKNGEVIVAEIKKSSKSAESAEIQLIYYMEKLREIGINLTGQLRFPTEKKIVSITFDEEKEKLLHSKIAELSEVISLDTPPKIIETSYCKKCGFQSLCFS
ncbi:CRISPR-associated protein Cas4 [Athalassotoga saccharophila]|nr:CRISPR-associated protein Cas4 [Athalassotoga saccharophila]